MRLPIPLPQLKKQLVQAGLITAEKFDALATEADRKKQNLADVLVSQKIADSYYLNKLIADFLGVELADLNNREVSEEAVRLVSEEVARQRQIIVFRKGETGVYEVAMADPSDLETIRFLTQHLNAKVRPFLATPEDLNRGFSIYGLQTAKDFKKIIEEQIQASLVSQSKTIEEAASQLPIVAIVDNIISYAIASRASDIHMEILEDATLVRYRIDGILYEIMRIPKVIHLALIARVKLLAALKLDEHYKPQDGRFRYRIVNQIIDVRVAVVPTFYGEKVEMRLLESTQKPLSLEELGMSPAIAQIVTRNLQRSYGMILSCGPTGSGKTTTLYSLMNILNRPEVNIVTTEDPIEYNMRYVNQTQVNPQAGITFASSLRAILRQDPNIVMVGEVRDGETADIAVQAALTGHLILSSLHTNDAPTAVPRLLDLKVPAFLLSSVLSAVVAQRLVRKNCQSCVYSYSPGPELESAIREQLKQLNIDAKNFRMPKVLYRGKGCSSCNFTGYHGRIGIFEVLEVTDKIRKLIMESDFNAERLRDEAQKEGMKLMFEDGLEKVELAITTIEEVLRVIRE